MRQWRNELTIPPSVHRRIWKYQLAGVKTTSEVHIQAFVRRSCRLINLLRMDQVNVRFYSHVEIYAITPTPYSSHNDLKWAFMAENGEQRFLSGSLRNTTGVWTSGRLVAMETAPLQHTNSRQHCADKQSANHRLLSWDVLCVSCAPVWWTLLAKCLWLVSSGTFKILPFHTSKELQNSSGELKSRDDLCVAHRELFFGLKTIQLLKY